MDEEIEVVPLRQLEEWEREFSKIENILKLELPEIPYPQRAITKEIIRREFLELITPSYNDTN